MASSVGQKDRGESSAETTRQGHILIGARRVVRWSQPGREPCPPKMFLRSIDPSSLTLLFPHQVLFLRELMMKLDPAASMVRVVANAFIKTVLAEKQESSNKANRCTNRLSENKARITK